MIAMPAFRMPISRRARLSMALVLVALAGPGGARAQGAPPYRVRMEMDVRIPMPDGVTLSADVYRPDAPGRFPVILVRTPYDNGTAASVARGKFWASRGYAYVVQDVRGRGDSDGTFYPLVTEAVDGDATVTWCGTQPWSSGKVGTFGGSYLGWTQAYLATIPNPHLAAMILVVTPPDPWRNFPVQFGAYSIATPSWLALLSGHTLQDLSELDLQGAFRHLPIRDADLVLGRRMPAWRDWLDHPTLDDYWRRQAYQEKLLATKVPILHVSGWYDDVLVGTLENFVNLTTRATDLAERERQWMLIGPWPHAVNSTSRLAGIDFGPDAVIDFDGVQRRFFDRWLKGIENGQERDPRVRLFVMGANEWRDEREWPLARARQVSWYLHSGGRANSLVGDGTLSTTAPGEERPDRYDYDPTDPAPFLGVETFSQVGTAEDYRPVERRDDVLVYSSAPFEEPLTVCGPVRARLFAASSARDTDWIVRLVDVHPGGYAQRINDGIVRARYRRGFERAELLTPGRVEEYEVDLWGTCLVLQPGHRLRVEVTSSALPKFDRNLNTGGPIGSESTGVIAHQTIHHDRLRPSALILPMIPNGR